MRAPGLGCRRPSSAPGRPGPPRCPPQPPPPRPRWPSRWPLADPAAPAESHLGIPRGFSGGGSRPPVVLVAAAQDRDAAGDLRAVLDARRTDDAIGPDADVVTHRGAAMHDQGAE